MEECYGWRDDCFVCQENMRINFFITRKTNCLLLMNIHFKFLPNGQIECLKAWLVIKGYTQTYGVNYFETFSLIAHLHSIHIFLSVAVVKNGPLYQLDIKNESLHGNLQEEVYMLQPPIMRFRGRDKVYELKKNNLWWSNLHEHDLTNSVLLLRL